MLTIPYKYYSSYLFCRCLFSILFRFHDRIYIANVRLRRLLKRYAIGGQTVNGKKIKLLAVSEKQTMMNDSEKSSRALFNFLAYVDDDSMVAPKTVKDILLSLSWTSPVCSYIHVNSSLRRLVDSLTSGVNVKNNPLLWNSLRDNIPLIFNAVDHSSIETIPRVVDLVEELWSKAESTFVVPMPNVPDTGSIEEDELSHFPSLTKIRNRGV